MKNKCKKCNKEIVSGGLCLKHFLAEHKKFMKKSEKSKLIVG